MNTRPVPPGPRPLSAAVASAIATLIALTALSAVTILFQSRGAPLAELAVAERACAQHAYLSEREACMRDRIAAERGDRVARR